ncbi:AbiTii domain-containing protein [Nesterenkonia suensis]
MRDILDQAIQAANDDNTPLTTVLRNLLTVGHRVGSAALKEWAENELHGYGEEPARLPHYRKDVPTAVSFTFVPMYGMGQEVRYASPTDVPDDDGFRDSLFKVQLTHPASEMVEWVGKDNGPSNHVGVHVISQLREWGDQRKAPAISGAVLNGVRRQLSPATIAGVVDQIRTTALELCLSIESELPPDGAPDDEPGRADAGPGMPERVNNLTIQYVYQGATGHLYQAQHIDVTVNQGDVDGLLKVARELGLGNDAVSELREAVEADGRTIGDRVKDWVGKVKQGAFKITGEASAQIIAGQMLLALGQFGGSIPVV